MRTIEHYPLPSLRTRPIVEDFYRCRDHYARGSCIDPRNGKRGGFHYGQDMWAPEGTLIEAPCDLEIKQVSTSGDYGNFGKAKSIKTGRGIWFAHCQYPLRKGIYLKQEPIGRVGTTGTSSTGPHLHIELHDPWSAFNSAIRIWGELEAARLGLAAIPTERKPMSVKCEGYQSNDNRIDLFFLGDNKDCLHSFSLDGGISWKTENLFGDLLEVSGCDYKGLKLWVWGIGINQKPYSRIYDNGWATDAAGKPLWRGGS